MSSSIPNLPNMQVIDSANKYNGRFPPPYDTTHSTSNKYNELTVSANQLLYNDESLDTSIIILPRAVYLNPSTNEVFPRYNAIFRRLREMSIGCGHNFKDFKTNLPMYIHILVKGYDINTIQNFDVCYGVNGRQNFYINYESNTLYQVAVKNVCDQFADRYNSFILSRSSVDLLVDPLRSFFITISRDLVGTGVRMVGIYDVCTSETSRRKGYLSILLQDLINNCGYDIFFLTVDLANPSFENVCRQYIRVGFIKPTVIEKDVISMIPLQTKQVLLSLFKRIDVPNQTIKDDTYTLVKTYFNNMSSVKLVGYTKINFRIPPDTYSNIFNLFIKDEINNDIIRKEIAGAFIANGVIDNRILLDISPNQIISGNMTNVQGYNSFVYTEDEYRNRESIQIRENINIFNSDYNYAHLSTGRKTPYINFHTHYRALEHINYKDASLCFLFPSAGDLIFSIRGIIRGGLLAHILFIDIGLFVIRINPEFKNIIQCIISEDIHPQFYNILSSFITDVYENEVKSIPGFIRKKGVLEKLIDSQIDSRTSKMVDLTPAEITSKEECIRKYDMLMNSKFTFSELKKYIEVKGSDRDRSMLSLICRDEFYSNIHLFNITFHKYGSDIDFEIETSTNYDSNEYIYNILKQGEFMREHTLNDMNTQGKNPLQIVIEKYNQNIGV